MYPSPGPKLACNPRKTTLIVTEGLMGFCATPREGEQQENTYLEPRNDVKKPPFHKNSLFQEVDPKTAREAEFGSGC